MEASTSINNSIKSVYFHSIIHKSFISVRNWYARVNHVPLPIKSPAASVAAYRSI